MVANHMVIETAGNEWWPTCWNTGHPAAMGAALRCIGANGAQHAGVLHLCGDGGSTVAPGWRAAGTTGVQQAWEASGGLYVVIRTVDDLIAYREALTDG